MDRVAKNAYKATSTLVIRGREFPHLPTHPHESAEMLLSVALSLLSLPFALFVANSAAFVVEKRVQTQCCPLDTFGDRGVLINTFPFFTCAYPDGACDWDSTVRSTLLAVHDASLIAVLFSRPVSSRIAHNKTVQDS